MKNDKLLKTASFLLLVAGITVAGNVSGQNVEKMKIEQTDHSTSKISWNGGQLELNMVPMNNSKEVEKSSGIAVYYSTVNDKGKIFGGDMVGIVGLQLDSCPAIPRILWDSREHQFWDGYDGAFEPRNTVVNNPQVGYACADSSRVKASYYYISNYVKTTEEWVFKAPSKPALATWDVHITTQNLCKQTLKNYLNFFACYHPADSNFYWGADNTIKACSQGSFEATANKEIEAILKQSPVTEHGHRYIGNMDDMNVQYHHPVLMSKPQPWYGGMRHIIMVEPSKCASIVTWGRQARDYMVRPEKWDLKPDESFTVTIRHVIAPVNSVKDLEMLWAEFEKDIKKNKK